MKHRARVGTTLFLVAAVFGVAAFGVLAWRSVSILEMDASGALDNFDAVQVRLPSTPPLVQRDASGAFVRRPSVKPGGPVPTELHALAYHADGQRLVRADVPMWFFKLKGPALRYAVRDTGLDLDALNLTATDLENAGTGVVLDETRLNGDRLLVWTELGEVHGRVCRFPELGVGAPSQSAELVCPAAVHPAVLLLRLQEKCAGHGVSQS